MISRIGVEDRQFKNNYANRSQQNPAFKSGLGGAVLNCIQACERNPMVNVAVIDLLSAILPRTYVESLTNWFAGFEAFRRESSGLIVNCMIPSVVAMGFAACLNNFVMPKGSNMTSCWADSSLIQKATDIYSNSQADDKVKDSLKEILKGIEGTDGKNKVKFGEALSEAELEEYANKLKELSVTKKSRKEFNNEISKITKEIADKTHVFEGVNVGNVKATTTKHCLKIPLNISENTKKLLRVLQLQILRKRAKTLLKPRVH